MSNTNSIFNSEYRHRNHSELLFQQYELYVGIMEKATERRHQTNTFFMTVNSTAITILAATLNMEQQGTEHHIWLLVAAIAGSAISLTWLRLIYSYRHLIIGKFKVIHLIETKLPLKLFSTEWNFVEQGHGKKYKDFSPLESLVPIIFLIIYITLGIHAGTNLPY